MSTPAQQTVSQPSGIYLGGLARRLLNDKLITDELARDLQQKAIKQSRSFVELLVESKQLTAVQVAEVASAEFGSPLIDLSSIDIDTQAAKDVGEKLLRKHRALPLFKRGKKMFVGISDPMNIQALDEFKFATGFVTEAILVEDDKLGKAIEVAASAADTSMMMGSDDSDLENLEVADEDDGKDADIGKSDADDAPIVRYVNKILVDAISRGASDIHFEPYEKFYRCLLYTSPSPRD